MFSKVTAPPRYNFSIDQLNFYCVQSSNRIGDRSSRGVHSAHEATYGELPYLWTKNIFDCVAIGFYAKPNDSTRPTKIELFHSMSEHGYSFSEKQIRAGVSNQFINIAMTFLAQVKQGDNIKIILSSPFAYEAKRFNDVVEVIMQNLNHCLKVLGLKIGPMTADNFVYLPGESDFYLTRQGAFGHAYQAMMDSMLSIAQVINEGSTLPSAWVDQINKLVSEGLQQLTLKEKDKSRGSVDLLCMANEYLSSIKEISHQQLFEKPDKLTDVERIICLKLVSWDPFLNQPTAKLLNEWARLTSYPLNDSLRKAVVKVTPEKPPSNRPSSY